MPNEEKKNRIKKLRESLYSKEFKEKPLASSLDKKEYEVKEEWAETSEKASFEKDIKKVNTTSIIKKIFISSIIFFIAALGFAAVKFYYGGNIISLDNVGISISGPVSINGGEEFELEVVITNNSDVSIQSPSLLVEYPEGAYSSFKSQDKLLRTRESMDTIKPKDSVAKKIPLVLFGEENSEKNIDITLEFRFQGSGAELEKKETYNIKLASSPINLIFNTPKETSSKQEFEMTVDLESNATNVMKDLIFQLDYPFGFTFKSATPVPAQGDNVWEIGDIAPSDKRIIKIRGTLEGQESDEKIFKASVGTKTKEGQNTIGTIYNFVSESISLTKPFLGLNLLIDGSSASEYVLTNKKAIRVDVLWKSNIPTRIIDGKIEVKLDGMVLDKFSVLVSGGGFYRSIDNTIVWDKSRNSDLAIIEPGSKGSVSFTLKALPLISKEGNIFKNPQINIAVSAGGERISNINVPEKVTTSIKKKVKIESDLAIAPRAVYYTGPFNNSGPLPPRAEKETTYTIVWTVTNSSNKISGAVVRTTLPTYVKWLNIISSTNEDISFNEAGGEVVWNIGDINEGAGFISDAHEVSFQVGFLPSVSQIGKAPFLTGDIVLSGKDSFTETEIKDITRGLSTQLSTDPYFNSSQAAVTY